MTCLTVPKSNGFRELRPDELHSVSGGEYLPSWMTENLLNAIMGIVVTGSTGGTGGSFSGGLGGIGGIGTSGGGSVFLPVVLTPEELEDLDDLLNPEPDPDPAPVDLDDQLSGSPSSPPSVPSESVRTLPGIDIGNGIEVFPVITGPLFDPTGGGIGIRVEIP